MSGGESGAPGAPAPEGFIPLSVPEFHGNEWLYVKECLDTGWVSSVGSYVERFEADMASATGTRFAVATMNGTSALHTALLVAGVRPDDEVLVSTLTFIAPANAVRYVGARPVFIDAEPATGQMDPSRVAEFLDRGCVTRGGEVFDRETGRRVKAIIPVHILGHPVDMDPVLELARRYGLAVVEDATESLGAEYKGRRVGQLGDIACFSFNGNKIITTGGGGMIVTNDEAWARKARYLTTQAKDDPVEFVHDEIGYNYRLTNVLAAIGVAQLERLPEYVAAKRRIAARYADALGAVPGLSCLGEAPWARATFWMSVVRVDREAFGADSRALLRALEARRIQTRPLWQPIHLSRPHVGSTRLGGDVAERLHRDCLTLPCSVGLTEEQQSRVIDGVVSFV
ncbi:MAG TPA: LegC family aminotransferase, partial [Demequinaceae bacterium]